MKKILFFTIFVLLVPSCSVKYPYRKYATVIDFTEITKSGFYITESNSVSFNYIPLGSLTSVVESGYEVLGSNAGDSSDDIYKLNSSKISYGDYIQAEPNEAIDELVSLSKEMGANGIINLKMNYNPAIYDKNGNVITASSYVVTGMAIKRLQN